MSTWGVMDKDLTVSEILDWQFSSSRSVSVCESVCACVCVCVCYKSCTFLILSLTLNMD